jgi:hypothetical protein
MLGKVKQKVFGVVESLFEEEVVSGKSNKKTIIRKISLESHATLWCFLVFIISTVGFLIRESQVFAHIAELSAGAIIGSLPGTVRTMIDNKNDEDAHKTE